VEPFKSFSLRCKFKVFWFLITFYIFDWNFNFISKFSMAVSNISITMKMASYLFNIPIKIIFYLINHMISLIKVLIKSRLWFRYFNLTTRQFLPNNYSLKVFKFFLKTTRKYTLVNFGIIFIICIKGLIIVTQ